LGEQRERQGYFTRRRLIIFGDIALVLIILVGVVSYFLTKSTTCEFPWTMTTQQPLGEIVQSPTIRRDPPPWPVEAEGLEERMAAAHTPRAPEGKADTSYTIRLDVYYRGQRVEIPSGVGHGNGFLAAVHTDDASGTIHVDQARGDPDVDMSDVFAVWGVRMTSNSLGDECNQGNSVLRLFINGGPVGGNVGKQAFDESAAGTRYAYAFGTDEELPSEFRQALAPEQLVPPQHPNKSPSG
jgi:hypothetical protein